MLIDIIIAATAAPAWPPRSPMSASQDHPPHRHRHGIISFVTDTALVA
jgi:hypothetical protein